MPQRITQAFLVAFICLHIQTSFAKEIEGKDYVCMSTIDDKEYIVDCPSPDFSQKCLKDKDSNCWFALKDEKDPKRIANLLAVTGHACLYEKSKIGGQSLCVILGTYEISRGHTDLGLKYLLKECPSEGSEPSNPESCLALIGYYYNNKQELKAMDIAQRNCGFFEGYLLQKDGKSDCETLKKEHRMTSHFLKEAYHWFYMQDWPGMPDPHEPKNQTAAEKASACARSDDKDKDCGWMLGFADIKEEDALKIAEQVSYECLMMKDKPSNYLSGDTPCTYAGSHYIRNDRTDQGIPYLEKDCAWNAVDCMILVGVYVRDNKPNKALKSALAFCDINDKKPLLGFLGSFIQNAHDDYCANIRKNTALPEKFKLGAQRFLRDHVGQKASGLPPIPRRPSALKVKAKTDPPLI